MTYEEAKGKYLPHEIIDLSNAGELSFEDANLLLYGSKTPPALIYRQDERGGYSYLDLYDLPHLPPR